MKWRYHFLTCIVFWRFGNEEVVLDAHFNFGMKPMQWDLDICSGLFLLWCIIGLTLGINRSIGMKFMGLEFGVEFLNIMPHLSPTITKILIILKFQLKPNAKEKLLETTRTHQTITFNYQINLSIWSKLKSTWTCQPSTFWNFMHRQRTSTLEIEDQLIDFFLWWRNTKKSRNSNFCLHYKNR